jgi:selenocysteine lyase/cysteine desulfurase
MALDRRQFLHSVALAAAATAFPAAAPVASAQGAETGEFGEDWNAVRAEFALSRDVIHMSAMLLASHPRQVREAIARYRDALDANPVSYLESNNGRLTRASRDAAAQYLGTETSAIALTDSTTQSVGLVYNGLRLKPGQEILTTEQDYYVTHESIRLAAARSGASVRRISLYDDLTTVSADAIMNRLAAAVRPATRVMALTWVHSSTGLKLPIAAIGEKLREINAGRDEGEEVLLCVDSAHGFGIEDLSFAEMGCDFLMAGCHKWLFGPRGTGIIAASERGWNASRATIPSFLDDGVFTAWLRGTEPDSVSDGTTMTPGGFKAFEHRWALAEAFGFHSRLGKDRIAARTHELASLAKQGLAKLAHVTLVTPMSPLLSAGIVSFNIDGYSATNAVRALRERGVIASAAPYATQYTRLTPSILNSPDDVEAALAAIGDMA